LTSLAKRAIFDLREKTNRGSEMSFTNQIRAMLGSTALVAASALPGLANTELHILHFNDFHSRIESISRFNSTCSASDEAAGSCFGGAARLYALVTQMRSALEAEGWQVHEAGTLREGLSAAGTRHPDLLVLDLGLPDGDGVELIRDVRGWSAVPIIVLSARTDETDKIAALDAGADDYLTKPFGTGELLARVRANLRRPRAATGNGLVQEAAEPLFHFGDVEVDRSARLVRKAGAEVHLTPTEYRMLMVLVANAGRVITQKQLLREVWGPMRSDQSHYLRIYMGHLRQKLEADPAQPRHLLTESGVGYRLAV